MNDDLFLHNDCFDRLTSKRLESFMNYSLMTEYDFVVVHNDWLMTENEVND